MYARKVCAEKRIDLENYTNRPLIQRLRESYLTDMVTVLQAANDGKFDTIKALDISALL